MRRVEDSWIKEWKCLFVGKYEDANLENEICKGITQMLEEDKLYITII